MKIFFGVLVLFSTSSFVLAVDKSIIDYNNAVFEIKYYVEVVKDKTKPQLERQREFSNLANEFAEPGGNWELLKTSVLDIINADVEFWAQEIKAFPAVQEKLIQEFSLDWYNDAISNYREKQKLSIIEIKRRLESLEKEKMMLKELLEKLEGIKPTTL